MEINKENFAEAIKESEFTTDILPLLLETDAVQTVVDNKADAIYKEKIDDEVKSIHTQYDNDMFEILGERPGTDDAGSKEKTYTKVKSLYNELKDLREKKDSLSKDTKVKELTDEIERLKTEGGAKHVKDMFDQAKLDWQQKEKTYKEQVEKATSDNQSFKKSTIIKSAMQQLKMNPDVADSVKKLVLENAEKQLIENSKFEGDDFIILNSEGKPDLNKSTYKPKSAIEALMAMDAIKDITLKADTTGGGGGADPTINGSIQTTSVDGKDTRKLILPEGSFKTKLEFQNVAKKSLMDSGISKTDDAYQELIDKAYTDYKVADMPIQ